MRIMFWGDLAGTGFGTVTHDMGLELLKLGHDVRFVSQNDLGDDLEEPFLSRTFQVSVDITDEDKRAIMGTNSLAILDRKVTGLIDGSLWPDGWTAEASIILGDYAAVESIVLVNETVARAFASIPTFHYIPIEGNDLPPSWARLWSVIQPVAMSEFGASEIEKITGHRPPVVYHGVDTTVFRPVSREAPIRIGGHTAYDKTDCKALFLAHSHTGECAKPCPVAEVSWSQARKVAATKKWVFRADRNMPRKRYASLLRAMQPVLATHEDTFLVLHCRVETRDQGGLMRDLIAKMHPAVANRVVTTGFHDTLGGASRELLVALYNAADVYVSTSAEGFGLTIAEAMACGVPVVGLDYSAVPEVVGPGGVVVPPAGQCSQACGQGFHSHGLIDNEYDHFWATVNEPAFGAAVTGLLDDASRRRELGRAATAHVRETFSWAQAARGFSDLFLGQLEVAA